MRSNSSIMDILAVSRARTGRTLGCRCGDTLVVEVTQPMLMLQTSGWRRGRAGAGGRQGRDPGGEVSVPSKLKAQYRRWCPPSVFCFPQASNASKFVARRRGCEKTSEDDVDGTTDINSDPRGESIGQNVSLPTWSRTRLPSHGN